MNDYGFELLSDQDIPIQQALKEGLFSAKNLLKDIKSSLNNSELAKRRFREIAQIAGLVFQGYPGQGRTTRHLQLSSSLFFEVFQSYEPDHLLLQQAIDEVLFFSLMKSGSGKCSTEFKLDISNIERPSDLLRMPFPLWWIDCVRK